MKIGGFMNRVLGKVRKSVTAMIAGALLAGGLVVAPQMQVAANAAVIQGYCNTSSMLGFGSRIFSVPTLGASGTRACMMNQGNYSPGVTAMQSALSTCHNYSITVDGAWGPATSSVVRSFQQSKGLTVDAEYGPQTHNAMRWFDYAPVVNLGNCYMDMVL